jgi:hypothetical protein
MHIHTEDDNYMNFGRLTIFSVIPKNRNYALNTSRGSLKTSVATINCSDVRVPCASHVRKFVTLPQENCSLFVSTERLVNLEEVHPRLHLF